MSGESRRERPAGPQGRGEDLATDFAAAEPPPMPRAADDPPDFPPFRRTSSRRVYDSPWCALRRDEILLPGGGEQDYHVFEVSNAVAVVPLLPDGRVLLLWQYRYPHGRSQWEVPAGRIHAGEDPRTAAERELLEETGHRSSKWTALPGWFPTGGISAHYAHAYLAEDCEEVAAPSHDGAEQILIRGFTRDEVLAKLHAGRFADAFSALALFYALAR
jgi:8-oxo-dGTP pyrophosphatase MutT (NUDIX family)